jgi:hypothetical protein
MYSRAALILTFIFAAIPFASAEPGSASKAECIKAITELDVAGDANRVAKLCESAQKLNECNSVHGTQISHFNFPDSSPQAKRILVFGLIHGDEPLAGQMTARWAERLTEISHRNEWRVVPMLNPDGYVAHTRTNTNGVDLNRNFPTKDWNDEAVKYWRKNSAGEKRRNPGNVAASEPETKCAMAQIQDFRPDFIVSVHTPYNVLDFDGPHLAFPSYHPIPWRSIGNFPGSLGRFMWKDHQVPVLTVELKETLVNPDDLQDMIGTFAIRSANLLGKRPAITFESLQGDSAASL